MKGWISIHRSIISHWLYPKGRAMTKYEAWITILLEVNHTEKKESKGFNLIDCKRGESIKSLDTWAKLFHWNKSKVRRFFIMLQNDSMIETKSVQKTTHLKVCNYDNYQNQRNETETELKRKRNETETELTPNNNDNKENNVNNDNKKTLPQNEFLQEREILNNVYDLFDFEIISSLTENQKIKWLDTINKLNRLDDFGYSEIEETIIWGRNDEFWQSNFLSILGLRKKKNGISKFFQINKKMNYEQTGKNGNSDKQIEDLRKIAESIANDPDLV